MENDALETISNKNISIGKFTLAKTGLVIAGDPSYEEWEDCGHFLRQAEKAVQFWIGDWLNYGDKKYGEMYSQAVDETDYAEGSLRNAKWVASQVELSRRRDNLSYSHHAEVAALPPEKQDYWLSEAEEKGLTRSDLRHAIKHERLALEIRSLPDDKYRVIYADPPWQYGMPQHSREEQETVLETHYPTMPLDDICKLPIYNLAGENAVLFLWATSPLLPQAFVVADAWGFEYKAAFIWDKVKHNVGYYNSVRHELLLICTRGSCLPDSKPGEPMLIDSVQSIERTEHSRKPEAFRNIIDNLYPSGKRIELFAREKHDDWDVWGNEA